LSLGVLVNTTHIPKGRGNVYAFVDNYPIRKGIRCKEKKDSRNILIFEVFMKNGQGGTRYPNWLHFAYYNLKAEAATLQDIQGIQDQPSPAKN
jgi:hypothetical protein